VSNWEREREPERSLEKKIMRNSSVRRERPFGIPGEKKSAPGGRGKKGAIPKAKS